MKKLFLVILLLQIGIVSTIYSQNYLQVSPRAGYDILPLYNNNTPYIDYKGGLEVGVSVDYYWKWFGMGTDFDYIKNKPKSIYPTSNLFLSNNNPINNFTLVENKITRYFYGVGPSFKLQTPNAKFTTELNLRGGLGGINGGQTVLNGFSLLNPNNSILLNFQSGYKTNHTPAAKAQIRFTYFLNQMLGVHLGAYYLRHFNTIELIDANYNTSAAYRPFTEDKGGVYLQKEEETRRESCKCNVSSIGIFGGISIRLPSKPKVRNLTKDTPPSKCTTCEKYALTVTARDKYTKELLPNTDVVLKDMTGNIIKSATTNSYGVVVFSDVLPDNYSIEGALYNTQLDGAAVEKSEFKPNTTIQKEIIYSDQNFILKGNAVACNTTTPLEGVSVTLKNSALGEQKNTVTNTKGEFVFNVKQQSDYQISGKKGGYFSQIENVSTKDFNRNTTLFVKLEICMEEAECGKAVILKNIYYDFDSDKLRPESFPELNKLVQFLNDNSDVKIELYSHTDSRGKDTYNQKLSQGRANSVVEYLTSKKISESRLKGIGFGEAKLLNRCADGVSCSETEHQLNRRTEVKVVCPK